MVKILGAVMTGFACGYLGFKISFAMKIRAESLNNIITTLEMLESEINFSMNKLKKHLCVWTNVDCLNSPQKIWMKKA